MRRRKAEILHRRARRKAEILYSRRKAREERRFSPNEMQMRFLRPRTGSTKRKLEVDAERERERGK